MSANYYKSGSHNVICDMCGWKRKRECVRKTWDGYMACTDKGCWYPKHPNEFPRRIIPDGLPVADARPRNVNYVTLPPITQWTTPGLMWTTLLWRWDDNPSIGDTYILGGLIDTGLTGNPSNPNEGSD